MAPFSIEWKALRVFLKAFPALVPALAMVLSAGTSAQESDITQTPNTMDAGIQKSLEEQIGGRPW